MYYLIQCETDKSLCVVKEQDVICDATVVNSGDLVTFFWSNKEYIGQILKRSEDFEFLTEEMKKMKQADKMLKKSQPKSPSTNTTSLGKRKSVKPRSFSPSEANAPKTIKIETRVKKRPKSENFHAQKSKILHKKFKNTERSSDSSDTPSYEENESYHGKENVSGNSKLRSSSSTSSSDRSPSKDDLKLQLLRYEKLFIAEQSAMKPADDNKKPKNPEPPSGDSFDKESQRVENLDESTDSGEKNNITGKDTGLKSENKSKEVDFDNGDDPSQLFGGDYQGEEMIFLEQGIYCKKKIYKQALGTSHLATHIARKLLEGVFRNTALLKCTLSGRPVRSQGKERLNEEVSCMHETARDVIINFSKKVSKLRGWTVQPDSKIRTAMAQKLVEIKQRARKNANAHVPN